MAGVCFFHYPEECNYQLVAGLGADDGDVLTNPEMFWPCRVSCVTLHCMPSFPSVAGHKSDLHIR